MMDTYGILIKITPQYVRGFVINKMNEKLVTLSQHHLPYNLLIAYHFPPSPAPCKRGKIFLKSHTLSTNTSCRQAVS